jgi:hypothetical protein
MIERLVQARRGGEESRGVPGELGVKGGCVSRGERERAGERVGRRAGRRLPTARARSTDRSKIEQSSSWEESESITGIKRDLWSMFSSKDPFLIRSYSSPLAASGGASQSGKIETRSYFDSLLLLLRRRRSNKTLSSMPMAAPSSSPCLRCFPGVALRAGKL